jgi:hypothetical protein
MQSVTISKASLNKETKDCHTRILYLYVGFEVLTEVVMKSSVFWDIMPYSPLKVNRRIEGKCLHIQGRIRQNYS